MRLIVDADDIYCITPENPLMNATHSFPKYCHQEDLNIPGVYMGRNAAFVKEYFPEWYMLYKRGHDDRIPMRAFPQTVNPTADNIALHLNPI